jgi:hypothetical protein
MIQRNIIPKKMNVIKYTKYGRCNECDVPAVILYHIQITPRYFSAVTVWDNSVSVLKARMKDERFLR